MKTKAIHILMLLAAVSFGCIACSDETAPQPVPDGGGQLRIAYKIAGVSMSRATEDGWDNGWNENKVTRIDLFVFNNDATLFKHVSSTEIPEFEEVEKAQTEQTFEQDKLTYNDIANGDYIYYMVANCDFDDNGIVEGVFTLDDLKEKLTSDLVFNQRQTSFAMDGMIENTPNPTDNTIILSFELERAAAKIRLSVFSADGTTSIINDCQYQLYNYVEKGTSVLAQSEGYGEQGRESMSSLENANLVYENSKVVFYSYPNDWFDESLLDADGTFKEDDIYAQDDLIDETRQTYILLETPYGEGRYYYKVPVNFAISKDNDKVEFSKEDIENLRNGYYRMLRNHIYDITVTIDREGGITEGEAKQPTLYYQVADYDEEEIDVPTFS